MATVGIRTSPRMLCFIGSVGWLKTDYYGAKTVDARLKKGWNVLRLKLLSSARAWNSADELDLRILDKDGRAFADVWGACVPPE